MRFFGRAGGVGEHGVESRCGCAWFGWQRRGWKSSRSTKHTIAANVLAHRFFLHLNVCSSLLSHQRFSPPPSSCDPAAAPSLSASPAPPPSLPNPEKNTSQPRTGTTCQRRLSPTPSFRQPPPPLRPLVSACVLRSSSLHSLAESCLLPLLHSDSTLHSTLRNTGIRFIPAQVHLASSLHNSISRAVVPPWVARRFRSRLFWTSVTVR